MSKNNKWWFTFGCNMNDLYRNSYVIIKGSWVIARKEMFRRFRDKWCGQYASAEDAGVKEFNLKEITR